jgi:threonine dehydrogenase-like Zn-dependent dehydrogenase
VLKRVSAQVVPPEIPASRATLAASLETALNAVWDAELCLGSDALVLGGGTIGVLVAHLAQQAGMRVVLVEPNPVRRQRAEALGLSEVRGAIPEAMMFDGVFEVTGNPALLDAAIAACRSEGRVVVVSFYGQKTASVALGERFHRERLRLVSSQVSVVPPALRGRFDHARRFATVLRLLRDERLDALVQTRTAFRDAEALYRRLALGQVPEQIVFDYASGASPELEPERSSG